MSAQLVRRTADLLPPRNGNGASPSSGVIGDVEATTLDLQPALFPPVV